MAQTPMSMTFDLVSTTITKTFPAQWDNHIVLEYDEINSECETIDLKSDITYTLRLDFRFKCLKESKEHDIFVLLTKTEKSDDNLIIFAKTFKITDQFKKTYMSVRSLRPITIPKNQTLFSYFLYKHHTQDFQLSDCLVATKSDFKLSGNKISNYEAITIPLCSKLSINTGYQIKVNKMPVRLFITPVNTNMQWFVEYQVVEKDVVLSIVNLYDHELTIPPLTTLCSSFLLFTNITHQKSESTMAIAKSWTNSHIPIRY